METTKKETLLDLSSLLPEITNDNIFPRLPAKSLGRFMSVSKPIRSLFTDPEFKKKHLAFALKQDSGHRKLIIPSRDLHCVDLESLGKGREVTKPLSGVPATWVEMIGSVNGLVCIYSEKGGNFLINPTTKETKRIPENNFPRFVDVVEACRHFGFGYDAVTDDYKVIQFIAKVKFNEIVGFDFECLDVYSLKKKSWKRISGLKYKGVGVNAGVFFNRAVHWVAKVKSGREVVAAFNLERDRFRDILLPGGVVDSKSLKAAVLNGRLCLVYDSFDKHDTMWVMDEYGVESSWRKIQLSLSYRQMTPVWSGKNNEVLLQVDGKFVFYNFESRVCRDLEFDNVTFRKMFVSTTYVESLISPNAYGRA